MKCLNRCLGNCPYKLLHPLDLCCALRRCLCTLDCSRLSGLLPNRLLPQCLAGCGLLSGSNSFHSSSSGFWDSFRCAVIYWGCRCFLIKLLYSLNLGRRTRCSTGFSMNCLWDCSLIAGNSRRFPLCRMNWTVVLPCRLFCIAGSAAVRMTCLGGPTAPRLFLLFPLFMSYVRCFSCGKLAHGTGHEQTGRTQQYG